MSWVTVDARPFCITDSMLVTPLSGIFRHAVFTGAQYLYARGIYKQAVFIKSRITCGMQRRSGFAHASTFVYKHAYRHAYGHASVTCSGTSVKLLAPTPSL